MNEWINQIKNYTFSASSSYDQIWQSNKYHGTDVAMYKKLNLTGHRTVTCKIE